MSTPPDDLKPVYLILSEQRLLRDQAVARLKKRVADVADLDMNSQTFDAESMDPDEVIAAANTLPFLSEKRLVVVTNIDKVNAASTDALVTYATDPAPTTVLALVGAKLAKNTRLYKAVDKLGGVVARTAPKRHELPAYVRRMFADRGREISLEAAERFVGTVGLDLQQLSIEIDKAIVYVGTDVREITFAHVDEIASTTAKRTLFDFTEALGDRDCRRALLVAGQLIDDGTSEYALHAMAVRMLRDLITARSLDERGHGEALDVARELGRPDWQVKRLPRQARGFERGELVRLLQQAAEAEAHMKTGRDPRLVLERWIIEACGAA